MWCRVCLRGDVQLELTSLQEPPADHLKRKIMACSNVHISKDDVFPNNICATCINNLNVAYDFKLQCESSDKKLKSFCKTLKQKNLNISEEELIIRFILNANLKTEPEYESQHDNKYENDAKNILNDKKPPDRDYAKIDDLLNIKQENDTDFQIDSESIIPSQDEDSILTFKNGSEDDVKDIIADLKKKPTRCKRKVTKSPKNDARNEKLKFNFKIKLGNKKNEDDSSKNLTQNKSIKKRPRGRPKKIYDPNEVRKPCLVLVCDQCGKMFKTKPSLRNHIRRHTGERPYMCSTCGKSFHVANELKKHTFVHTGAKPYKCNYCEKRFSDWGSRLKHERCHRGEKPYGCNLCPKKFSYSYALSRHMLTHSGTKAFSCEMCHKNFTLKYHLKLHDKKYHQDSKNEEKCDVIDDKI